MKNQSLLCVWAIAAAAACGSVSSNKVDAGPGGDTMVTPAGEFALAIDPGTLELTVTGQGVVALTLTRGDNFNDAVSLEVSGLPTGVTAALAASSLPDGTTTTDLTVTVGATADAGTSTVTVTGTAGSMQKTATFALTLSKTTVTGTVSGGAANVTVRIVGHPATTTDSNGAFTFTDVVIPYDIYIVGTEGTSQNPIPAINYYKGLTRPDPVVLRPTQTFTPFLLFGSSGTVSGARQGAGNNTDPMVVLWGSGTGTVFNGNLTSGSYSNVGATWFPAAATSTGTLYGLQITRGTLGAPTGYPGYAALANATVNASQNTVLNLNLAAPTTAELTGTITPPTSFGTPTLTLTQQFANRTVEIWTANTTNAASRIPVIGAGKTAFHAQSSSSGATSQVVFPGLNAATNVAFTLPAVPVMTGPANNATNVTGMTPFEFTTLANAVYKVSMRSNSANFNVFTKTGGATIPAVSELPIPSSTQFAWTVEGYGPATHIDDAAGTLRLGVSKAEFDGPMHFQMTIANRNFTTAAQP